jgi:hypothetical protein
MKTFQLRLQLPFAAFDEHAIPASLQEFSDIGAIGILTDLDTQRYDFYLRNKNVTDAFQFDLAEGDVYVMDLDLEQYPELNSVKRYAFTIGHPDTGLYDPEAPIRIIFDSTDEYPGQSFYLYDPSEPTIYDGILDKIRASVGRFTNTNIFSHI